jgi:hypothetical protein
MNTSKYSREIAIKNKNMAARGFADYTLATSLLMHESRVADCFGKMSDVSLSGVGLSDHQIRKLRGRSFM